MYTTGMTRRIDDLGRIVIPKEIRNSLRIKNGDSLEMHLEEDKIILKKYSKIKKINDLSQNLVDSINYFTNYDIVITDKENIVASSKKLQKDFLNKSVSNLIINIIEKRKIIYEKEIVELNLIENNIINCSYILIPIISDSDLIGSFILINKDTNLCKEDLKLSNIISLFISKYLEV